MNRLRILILFFCFSGLFLFCIKKSYAQISADSAFNIIKQQVLLDDLSKVDILAIPNLLPANFKINTFDTFVISPNYDSWFFLIDDIPNANWNHPCRYIFINSLNGDYIINQEYSLPDSIELNTVHSMSPHTGTIQEDLFSFSGICRNTEDHSNDYAVIINGGYEKKTNYERYYNDCAAIYSTLRYRYHYERDHIFVIMSDGTDPAKDRHLNSGRYDSSPLDLDGDGYDDIQFSAKKMYISAVFDILSHLVGPEDNLFVFVTDHGGEGSTIALWGEIMSKAEFAAEINKIDFAKTINIVMGQCYSGGYKTVLCGENRVLSTACANNEYSYSTDNEVYDEFCFHWVSAVNGQDPYGNNVNADYNGDGYISMDEAFLYAKTADIKNEHPQYCTGYCPRYGEVLSLSGIINLNIASNVVWNTSHHVHNDIIIDSSATLTISDTVFLADNSSIIVRPGGKLVVDGGMLTSACDGVMWQGIEVVGNRTKRQLAHYQGKVELKNGARIENAMCGIRTGLREDTVAFATTGGIILAEDATFMNNRQSVVINSYADLSPSGIVSDNVCSFQNCTFAIDNDNLFSANNTNFAEHVRLWDVKGVKFKGCDFENNTNNQFNNGRGIYAENAGLDIEVKCENENVVLPNDCGCPPPLSDSCTFSGFTTSVEVNTTGSSYAVVVNRSQFRNNGTGVRINGNHYATVTRCLFNLDQCPDHNFVNKGLYLDGCSGYKVEENQFERTTYPSGSILVENSIGIEVSNSGITNNSIYRNNFINLTKGVYVQGENGGLQIACDSFYNNKYDIYIPTEGNIATMQGTQQIGADNIFNSTQNSSIYNIGGQRLAYCHSIGSFHAPILPLNVNVYVAANACNCSSTLCGIGLPSPVPFTSFQSDMNAFAVVTTNQISADGMGGGTVETQIFASLQAMRQTLSETYYTAVRSLLADTVLDLNELEQWHTVAQPIADPYSLTETRFMMGYNEPFVNTDADYAELANYAEFHAMKLALQNDNLNDNADNNNSPDINWYALTDAQIAQLQTIAERNAGRASVMAKGVLCFFFGICYDDDMFVDDNADNLDNNGDAEPRSAKAVQQNGETHLNVYPNPTDDILYVELSGAGIKSVGVYDLQGRVVTNTGVCDTPQQGTAMINVRNVLAGVYVLRVTDENGNLYYQKIVIK